MLLQRVLASPSRQPPSAQWTISGPPGLCLGCRSLLQRPWLDRHAPGMATHSSHLPVSRNGLGSRQVLGFWSPHPDLPASQGASHVSTEKQGAVLGSPHKAAKVARRKPHSRSMMWRGRSATLGPGCCRRHRPAPAAGAQVTYVLYKSPSIMSTTCIDKAGPPGPIQPPPAAQSRPAGG